MKVLILHGPNLNMLGQREQAIYGSQSFDELNLKIKEYAGKHDVDLDIKQSNHEGELIDIIQSSEHYDFIILNPGAFTHYSFAIRDAISSISTPVIEIHLSNIYAREDFRKKSVISPVAMGQVSGFGDLSYILALQAVILSKESK